MYAVSSKDRRGPRHRLLDIQSARLAQTDVECRPPAFDLSQRVHRCWSPGFVYSLHERTM